MTHRSRRALRRPATAGSRGRSAALALALTALGGCAGAAGPAREPPATEPTPPTDPVAVPGRDEPERRARRRDVLERKPMERADPEAPSGISGEVPEAILARVRKDLGERTGGVTPTLLVARAVTWSSGALGCPEPGRLYTQATVPGYHVVYGALGRRWDYRLAENGALRLCEAGGSGRGQPLQ